jgi:enoyl-CoA hydratase/carnithine racemase
VSNPVTAVLLNFRAYDTLLELAAAYQALSHQTPDHREAVAAFLEKRPPVFGG